MNLSFKILEGKKIILQSFTKDDITNDYVDWLNDPRVVKFSNQRFKVHSTDSCLKYLATFEGTKNRFVKIIQKTNGAMIGTMTAYADLNHTTVDLGILIGRQEVWGRGLGLDSWTTFLNWLLITGGVRKVTAGTMGINAAMVRIMEKSGMLLEAVRCGQELLDGKPQDLVFYGKFAPKKYVKKKTK